MSAAVENGVDASKPHGGGGVFSRAFAKRAQPYEEGESDDSYWSLPGRLWCCTRDLLPLSVVLGKINIVLVGFKPCWCPPCEVSAGNSRHLRAYLGNGVNQTRRQNTHGVPRSDVHHTITGLLIVTRLIIIYFSVSRIYAYNRVKYLAFSTMPRLSSLVLGHVV
jgi:hypothetical protein